MKLLALAALVCVPIAATVGYVAHRDPPPPTFAAYLADTQGIKHVPGDDTDEWLAVAATGPNKGGAMEVTQALSFFPTHQALEQSAQGEVVKFLNLLEFALLWLVVMAVFVTAVAFCEGELGSPFHEEADRCCRGDARPRGRGWCGHHGNHQHSPRHCHRSVHGR